MRIAIFSTHDFEKANLERANKNVHQLMWITEPLSAETAPLAKGCDAAIVFANDDVGAASLDALRRHNIRYITTRTAGYDHIDLAHAKRLGMKVGYVPEYSPNAIAEHAIGLMLVLNRRLIEADNRVSRYDFRIDGLTGFDMKGKTVGIIGMGNIGSIVARILSAFGCRILAYDLAMRSHRNYEVHYVSLEELCAHSDIISLHVPLTNDTRYMIDKNLIKMMKPGAMLINTSRGDVINTEDVLEAVRSGKIGLLGVDVYEREKGIFFHDLSGKPFEDQTLKNLIEHPNVLITAHQAFLTENALRNIAETTFYNLNCWANGFRSKNELVD